MGDHEDAMWGKERSRRPIPSASMAQHQPGKQQRKECCSVSVMSSISPTSMIRNYAFAIGLSNYPQLVMPTRTIVLPAVSGTLAQAPAHPAARCALQQATARRSGSTVCSSEFDGRSTAALATAHPCLT